MAVSYVLTDLISPRVAKLRTLFIHPSLPSIKFSLIDVKPVGADRMNIPTTATRTAVKEVVVNSIFFFIK